MTSELVPWANIHGQYAVANGKMRDGMEMRQHCTTEPEVEK
jgi:hypothetical protein